MRQKGLIVLSIALITIPLIATIGCSCFIPSLNIPWEEHESCSPDMHLTQHSIACARLSSGDIQCTMKGTLENKGIGAAKDVQVNIQWVSQYDSVFWNPDPTGDMQPGQTADFEARFNGYEYPSRYDIYILCTSYQ